MTPEEIDRSNLEQFSVAIGNMIGKGFASSDDLVNIQDFTPRSYFYSRTWLKINSMAKESNRYSLHEVFEIFKKGSNDPIIETLIDAAVEFYGN